MTPDPAFLMTYPAITEPAGRSDYAALRHIRAFADRHRVSAKDLIGPSRVRALAHLRFRLWVEMRAQGLSYARIAMLFGRDHASVVYGVARARALGLA